MSATATELAPVADYDPNTHHRIAGITYRVCTYRTVSGWSSFTETARGYLAATGEHDSWMSAHRAALELAHVHAAQHGRSAEPVAVELAAILAPPTR